ncbi:glycosyltransferase family 8 protein [Campylobacter lari]|uniref:glycosyltransferase family 8 protein n=2 Tax=Campylobacter lari TaxID=201 RepID=UPI000E195B92|nr:glycosyltransferase family 8 protein [Campylobacter lari]QKF74873.1 glycosyltransferase, family 8 [Campylobacter lari subsp. lari]QQT72297.1 glycosyltransferase family 8 protein [Campylobacter lari]TXE69077.1 glycosyltransferase family 8 protein [Campylobacter lari]SUX07051.1 glycosyl transferase family protein [Campylobacter lari]
MLHIAFSCSIEYIKYCAVVITSILMHGSHKEEYRFYIITSSLISKSMLEQINIFEKKLNENYTVNISLFFINEDEYKNHPIYAGSTASFWRLKIADALPSDVDKCIFLGVDVLVLGDIKKLIEVDLQNKTVGMAPDCFNFKGFLRSMKSRDIKKPDFIFPYPECYSNVDVMLIDLKQWRQKNIAQQCELLFQHYIPKWVEQDLINAVLGDDIYELSPRWNFWIGGHYVIGRLGKKVTFKGESLKPYWKYTRSEFEQSERNIQIAHFTHCCRKPWVTPYSHLDQDFKFIKYPYYDTWWHIAMQTPVFKEELIEIYKTIENNKVDVYQNTVISQIKSLQVKIKDNELKLVQIQTSNNTLNNTIKEKDSIIKSNITQLNQIQSKLSFQTKYGTAKTRIQNQLSYKLGQAMIVNSKSFLGYLIMPMALLSIMISHKQEQKVYQEKIKKVPSLKLPILEDYPDYKEALKLKNHLSYKLGQALIQANKTWYKGGYVKMWFEIRKLKRVVGKV